ncbi:MAG TPA: hypothetical protein VN415_09545 [Dehalococcoidia bacterium]|nr:hypothetical protein [Dehalococcoidia bacterium]
MKRHGFLIAAAVVLLVLTAGLYLIHYAIFRDAHHIYIYLVGDLAFLPLEVLLVALIIDRVLDWREKRAMLSKMNMVVGVFFSEMGTRLLGELLPGFDRSQMISGLGVKHDWGADDFRRATDFADNLKPQADCRAINLEALKGLLSRERDLLLRLLENPNLLEHERFTDMLWAVSHLAEELEARPQLQDLPKSDEAHIGQDIGRAFTALAAEWLDYVQHLKSHYPYLFSLVLRTHPLQEHPSATVATASGAQAPV